MTILKLPKRFIEIIQNHGIKEAWKRSKTYFLFRIPDSFFWHPVTEKLNERYTRLSRSDLREESDISIATETDFIPFKSDLGIPERDDQGFYRPRDRFVTVLEDVTFRGKYGLVTDSENNLLLEAMGPPNIQPRRTNLALKQAIQELNISFNSNPEERLEFAAPLTISHGDAYYHWTIESLGKILMLEKYGEKKGEYPDLLVREDRKDFMDESLEVIDYPGDIKYWSGGNAEVKNLVVPSYPDPTVEELEWLRNRMIENSDDLDIGEERILITRQDADVRQIENFEEVKNKLEELGFTAITPGEHSIEEQVNIFKEAEIIIGVHGAGLTNIIYPEDAQIIEIVGERKSHASFSRISYIRNLDYTRIYCKNEDEDIIVDIQKLHHKLDNIDF